MLDHALQSTASVLTMHCDISRHQQPMPQEW